MSANEPVIIFRDLPATFPEEDKYKKSSVISSVVFHGLLILTVLIVPLLLPQAISQRELLVALVVPVGPPPAPPPPPADLPVPVAAPVVKPQIQVVSTDAVIMPSISASS